MKGLVKGIKGLFKYRELMLVLAWKEIRIKYKEPALGFLWALLVPLLMSLIFMFVFGKIFKVETKGCPFFIFLITGMFPWNFFALCFGSSVMSVLEGGALIKKVYFPREIIPLSIVLANTVNFLFSLIVVMALIFSFGINMGWYILLLPAAFILQIMLVSGLSMFIAGAQVVNRDTKFIVELGLLLWFYLSPVFYPPELLLGVSKNAFDLYSLNPFVGLITLYRVSLLGNAYLATIPKSIDLIGIINYAGMFSLIVFLFGYRYFKNKETLYADLAK